MTDLDALRHTLRAQEFLAPDPGAVLAGATRRIRRRRVAGVAAVTLTVAAVAAVAVGALDRVPSSVAPASRLDPPPAAANAGAAAEQVPPAAPAVSLEDGSWQLLSWALQSHSAWLHYGQAHRYGFDIEVHRGTARRGALAAKPSDAGQLTDPQEVMWQDGPDRWFRVATTKPVKAAEMFALLGKIKTTPPVIPSPLKSVQVPDGLKVTTFTSEPDTNTLVLCPDPESTKAPIDSRCLSLVVSLTSRTGPPTSADPQDPLSARRYRKLGAYTLEADSSPANTQAAQALLDSVQLNR